MKTADDIATHSLPGIVGVHRYREGEWLYRPSLSIGAGPWLARPWPSRPSLVPALRPIALAFAAFLTERDPRKTWRQAHELADDAEPILISGTAPMDKLLRAQIAGWFEHSLGVEVPDIYGAPP